MKDYTKEALRDKAERIMAAHKAQSIYATSDGEVFLQKHLAVSHSAEGRKPDEALQVYTYGDAESAKGMVQELMAKLDARNAVPAAPVDLHDSPEAVQAAEAAAAKAAQTEEIPGAGKGKKPAKAEATPAAE